MDRVAEEVVFVDRAVITDHRVELLSPGGCAGVFAIHTEVLRRIGDRLGDINTRTGIRGREKHAVDLASSPPHIGVVGPDVPVIGRGIAIIHRRRIAPNAYIGGMDILIDDGAYRSGLGIEDRDIRRRTGGIGPADAASIEHLLADTGIGQRQRVAVGIKQRAGAGAVDVGRLIPHEVEILLARLRQIGVVTLVPVTDVLAPCVNFVAAVAAAGGDEEVAERPRPQIPVFVELRQAVAALENVPVSLRIVEEAAPAELDETVRPPGKLDDNRSLNGKRRVSCQCAGHDGRHAEQ